MPPANSRTSLHLIISMAPRLLCTATAHECEDKLADHLPASLRLASRHQRIAPLHLRPVPVHRQLAGFH
uniref:Secreted protein n=1 Tax=Arundo donax TaxID=35708 RepID=A0A0A8YQT9_ARUDO